LLLMK